MYIKRYTIAALVLIILVGWYVYAFITQSNVSINVFGVDLPSLTIAIWVIIPLVLLYIASVAHMGFYSFLGSLKLRKYDKDYEKMIESIVDAYLGKKDRLHAFKTDRYKLLGALVDSSTIYANEDLSSEVVNDKIEAVLKCIEDIKSGEVADLKKYSLPSYNELAIQNERNRYKKGKITAEGILGHLEKYDDILAEEVYIDFVKTAPLNMIEKYKKSMTKEALIVVLSRVNSQENTLEISNDVLISLFYDLELSKKDYVNASDTLSKTMIPEQRIKLFETMSNNDDKVMDAYLFTLFDLEMLAPANDILNNSQDSEYMHFKAYSALRECGKHFDIHMFL